MGNNVLIPRSTLERIALLFECIDFARLPNCYDYLDVLLELRRKIRKLEIRETYAKIIRADDPNLRQDARIEYLWEKSQLDKIDADDLPF